MDLAILKLTFYSVYLVPAFVLHFDIVHLMNPLSVVHQIQYYL